MKVLIFGAPGQPAGSCEMRPTGTATLSPVRAQSGDIPSGQRTDMLAGDVVDGHCVARALAANRLWPVAIDAKWLGRPRPGRRSMPSPSHHI